MQLFDVIDFSKARPGREIVLERLDLRHWSFSQSFDAAISQVLHVSDYLVARGGTLREETIADSLHVAAN